jgi:calsequestrin|nr:MAG TPA: Transcription factor SPT20, Protein SPT3, Transcription, Histone acetyltransferase, Histone.9A [Caudoviricetes sp.]
MLIKESVLNRGITGNGNALALLESMNYIERTPYHAAMVPVVENVRLKSYVVDLADILRLAEEKEIEVDDAVIDVADANGIEPEDVVIAIGDEVLEDEDDDDKDDDDDDKDDDDEDEDDEEDDEEDDDDEDDDDDKKKEKLVEIEKIVKECSFYCVRKYSPKSILSEEARTERIVNNTALLAKTRNYIGDKIAKVSEWADKVEKEYNEASPEDKGILKKIKLIIAKILKGLSIYLEYLVRPDLTDKDFERVKSKVNEFSKIEVEKLQNEQKKLFGKRTVRFDINYNN